MGDVSHKIVLEGELGPWRRVVNVERFRLHSLGIYQLINADVRCGRAETRIQVPPYLSFDTLKTLITCIHRQQPCNRSSNFVELLRLSTAIWKYRCNPEPFARVFESRQDEIRPREGLGEESAGWTFIALVFGWRQSFESASQELIVDFQSKIGVIAGVGYFPTLLQRRIAQERLELTRKTFRFIKDHVTQHRRSRPEAYRRIDQRLHESGIDISRLDTQYVPGLEYNQDAEPETRGYCSPREMLDTLENILLDEPQKGLPMDDALSTTASATTSSASGSGRENRLSSVAESSTSSMRVTNRSTSSSSEVSMRDTISKFFAQKRTSRECRRSIQYWGERDIELFNQVAGVLRGQLDVYKVENFCGLDIDEFQGLRREQLLIS